MTLEVSSKAGEGSVFTIHFKKGKSHFPGELIQPSRIQKADPGFIKSMAFTGYLPEKENGIEEDNASDVPTVLVAEDNGDMRDFVSSVLKESFTVVTAKDGREALELVKNHLPDLIVADIMMPNMDGMQLNHALKRDPMLESIPLIFLTAKADAESELLGMKEDADDYLTKPFDAEILVARVDNLIRKRKRLREYYLSHNGRAEVVQHADPFLNKVNEILEKHFADPGFGVSELSREVNLERSRLFRKLKEGTGKSPQQYLIEFRMKKSAEMLQQKEGNISEVAYASGFNSLSYFSRCFRVHFGKTPSEFG